MIYHMIELSFGLGLAIGLQSGARLGFGVGVGFGWPLNVKVTIVSFELAIGVILGLSPSCLLDLQTGMNVSMS